MEPKHTSVDPARFNSPLAETVAWTPNSYHGFRLRTCRLVRVGAHRIEFRACMKMYVIGAGMVLAGLFVVFTTIAMSGRCDFGTVCGALFGAAFAAGGVLVLVFSTQPVTFDARLGCCWKGRTPPAAAACGTITARQAPMSRIKAIQLIAESCSHKGGSFLSYEVNIVLDDGSRQTVMDHGILRRVREDAAVLGAFIGVPVWDAIDSPQGNSASLPGHS